MEYRKGYIELDFSSHLDANSTLAWLLIIGLRRFTIITPGNDITGENRAKITITLMEEVPHFQNLKGEHKMEKQCDHEQQGYLKLLRKSLKTQV